MFYKIVRDYGDDICLIDRTYSEFYQPKRFVTLIRLTNPKTESPFEINKKGFGSAAAWLAVEDIKSIRLTS